MLIRRAAVPLAAALLVALAPPLMGEARADSAGWARQLTRDLKEARDAARGRPVKIAVLSDGVASGVATLKGAVEKEKDFVGTPRPKREAGTIIASLLVGRGGGLVPGATILPVRVYATERDPGGRKWQEADHWRENIAAGIRYAADQGADVIAVNVYSHDSAYGRSTGGHPGSGGIQAAVAYAHRKNAVVVAASGRQDLRAAYHPAGTPGIVGVGTVTAKGRRDKENTSASSAVLVSAPGVPLLAIGVGNAIWELRGESAALVFGTAAAAMLKARYPRLTPPQVVEALSKSARHPKGKGHYDTDLGFGYVNPAGALSEARRIGSGPVPGMTAESSVPEKSSLGERPETIRAVPYNTAWFAGFGGLILAGVVALASAAWLALRRPRRKAPDVSPSPPS